MKKILFFSFFVFFSVIFLGSFLQTARADDRSEIINKYKKLIQENNKKYEEINGKPDSQEKELQLEANLQYKDFLSFKMRYEICELERQTSSKSCAKEEKDMLEKGSQVRKFMSELTHLEQARNKNMTFNVSKYYSLPGQQQSTRSFLQVTNMIADWMIMLVGSVAVTVLIIGGLVLLFAGTNETYKEYGKFAITHSFIGILLVLLAYAIIAFLQSIFY